jgi:putative sugar O-methyltransferase
MKRFDTVILNLDSFKENDLIGSPVLSEYPNFGKISPSTIRYIKQSTDIFSKFNDVKSIVEVGGGYGGLAKILHSVIKYKKYTLIDFQECNALSEKYLNNFLEVLEKINFLNCLDYNFSENYDLFISNYAVSETPLNVQKKYYDDVISRAKYLYITYNNLHGVDSSYVEFLNMLNEKFDIFTENDRDASIVIYGVKK